MTDPVEHLRWHEWFAGAWTEKRPTPLSMTDKERLDWLGEYCDKYEYSKPQHVIIDCLGQRTAEANFRDAVDAAAARFKAANK